ncbi:MAG: SulP family inorganic anion transporter [Rhodospirillales bacterium]
MPRKSNLENHKKENDGNGSFRDVSSQLSPSQLLPNLFAGVVIAISAVVTGSGVAALAFPGALQNYIFIALGVVLISAIIHLTVMAIASSHAGIISLPQETPAAIMGLLAGNLAMSLPETMPMAEKAAAIVLAFGAATAITGICFMLLGHFRLGGMIRFIPYPVVGGVLAGLGWLLLQGGFSVLIQHTLSFETIGVFSQSTNIPMIAGGTVAALALFAASMRFNHYLTLPMTLVVCVAVFYLVALAFGMGPEALSAEGWLLGPFPEGNPWSPPTLEALQAMDWGAVAAEFPTIGTLVLVSTITVLLYASGVELLVRRDIDLNRELRACGLANLLAGIGGGVVGFHSMSDCMLARQMHASSRLTGLFAAIIIVAALFLGLEFLSYFPRPVLAGLLFFLGGGLLYEWLVSARHRLPKGDWIIVVMILLVSAWFGYLAAIGVGIVAGIVLFVVNYSRLDVAKHHLNGETFRSNVDRHEGERAVLDTHGQAIQIMTLQGFLFFGTANKILEKVAAQIQEEDQDKFYIVLDFQLVTGMDTSCLLTFRKLQQMAEDRNFQLVMTGLSEEQRLLILNEGIGAEPEAPVHFEEDLDHGAEWCEEQLLKAAVEHLHHDVKANDWSDGLPVELRTVGIDHYTEELELGPEEYLIREGESADDMYFIREGKVSIHLEQLGEDAQKRLRIYGPGTIVGEIAMYMGGPRSASVVTKAPTVVSRITREGLDRMRKDNPEAAAVFHQYVARLLCERMTTTNELLRRLL